MREGVWGEGASVGRWRVVDDFNYITVNILC